MNPLESADRMIRETGELPPMPHIASRVMQAMSDPNTDAKALQKIISEDQSLAARVLRMSNSSFYARANKVTNLSQAIVTLGFQTIRSLVLAGSVHRQFKLTGDDAQSLWEHSLGCALASRALARSIGSRKVEEAFLAGLLHDIGKTILLTRKAQEMKAIFEKVRENPTLSFLELEEEAFGFDHSQLGQLLARHWKFAGEIEEAIGNHHYPQQAPTHKAMAFVTSVANSICHKLEIGPRKMPDLDLEGIEGVDALGMDGEMLQSLLSDVKEGFEKESSAIFS